MRSTRSKAAVASLSLATSSVISSSEAEKETINDDVVFEIELIKQVEITVDYILILVQQYRKKRGDGEDKEILAEIRRAIDSSPGLRNKKDLIEAFVARISASDKVDEQWHAFVTERRAAELERIIEEEGLRPEETREFVERSFRDGAVQQSGTAITKILPPVSRFAGDGGHREKKRRVLTRLVEFCERFFGLVASHGGH